MELMGFSKPIQGAAALRRLTRTRRRNAIRDLLGLHVDISALLPGEEYSNEGFDNDASTLVGAPVLRSGMFPRMENSDLGYWDPKSSTASQPPNSQ